MLLYKTLLLMTFGMTLIYTAKLGFHGMQMVLYVLCTRFTFLMMTYLMITTYSQNMS